MSQATPKAEAQANQKVTDSDLVDVVDELYDQEQTLLEGGVQPRTIAETVGIDESTARSRLKKLCEKGLIEEDWGMKSPGELPFLLGYQKVNSSEGIEIPRIATKRDSEQ